MFGLIKEGLPRKGFPGGASGEEPAVKADVRNMGLIPGLGRSPGGGHCNPRQYSCIENPMDSGAWWAAVQWVAKSQTRPKQLGGLVAKSCPTLVTPLTVTCQAPLSMGFSRQEYWSGLPFPSPGDLPDPGLNPSLPQCGRILYQLNHKGSPRILQWVAYSFSNRASQPRN